MIREIKSLDSKVGREAFRFESHHAQGGEADIDLRLCRRKRRNVFQRLLSCSESLNGQVFGCEGWQRNERRANEDDSRVFSDRSSSQGTITPRLLRIGQYSSIAPSTSSMERFWTPLYLPFTTPGTKRDALLSFLTLANLDSIES